MTDRITKKRIGQLKEWLNNAEGDGYGYSEDGRAVADLEYILDQHQPAPTLMDLRGIAPDATGDLSSEEFVRRVREGWTPPWKKPAPTDEERRAMIAYLNFKIEDDPAFYSAEFNYGRQEREVLKAIRALLLSPAPADEERGQMIYCLDAWERQFMREGIWSTDSAMIAHKIRSLILSASAPKTVTRGQVEQFVPCICIDAYKDRGLAQPDCPRCSLVDMDGLLAYLNYGIAFGEAREAVDSEEGKEEK